MWPHGPLVVLCVESVFVMYMVVIDFTDGAIQRLQTDSSV